MASHPNADDGVICMTCVQWPQDSLQDSLTCMKLSGIFTCKQACRHMKQSDMVVAGSPAAILARQQKLAGSARRQLHMNHLASPVSSQLGAAKPELQPRLHAQSRAAGKEFHLQQQESERMQPPTTEQAPQHGAQSEDEEIFPGAVPEVAEEAAASRDLADTDSGSAAGGAAITDSQVAADKPAAGSAAAQTATADIDFAAMTAADTESATMSANDQSVGAIIQHAAASVAAAHNADMPVALLLSDEASKGSATAEASAQQGLCHVPPAGSDTQEGYGRQYPWMEAAGQTSASGANTEQPAARAGAESVMQQPHVTFAAGAMACSGPSKIPMRYLAAAAADRRSAAQEAAAAAAACIEADRTSVAKPAARAAAAAAGTDAENLMEDVVVSWAGDADGVQHIQQAAEQDWAQSDRAVAQVHAPALPSFPEPGSALSAFQPSSSLWAEPENAIHGMPRDVPGHAEEGGLEAGSDGNEQSDSVSVASFANSAASGLGHLLRAQQAWSESSSSPDRTSTTGSAEVRDISQLEAEVISQPPQEVLLSDEDAGLGSQLPMQLLLSHGQEQHVDAQPVLVQDQAQLVADEEQEQQQQREWQGGNQAESHDKAWSSPSHASSAEAGTPVVGYATGKQITN